ncbi:hypothetical protein Gpo141_00012895 [Globisporangium polare]
MLYHVWDKLHVERHGKYSVERLYSFKLHSERTSHFRALLVILLTPIPCILTTILADLIPLAPPELGLAHSEMFWIRATCICWYVSFTIVNQCRYFISRLPMTSAQVLGVNTFVVATSTAIGYAFAKVIGFPLPFFQAMITPGWLVGLAISIGWVWGKHFKDDPHMKYEMIHYSYVVTAQTTLTFVYPAYIFVFRKLKGPAQVVCALFLPVMKVLAKNGMNYLLHDLEDAKPEFIIFNVEVFHALFVACCMQMSTSYHTTIVLMVSDFVFAILSLHKIFSVIRGLDDLVNDIDAHEQDGQDRSSEPPPVSLNHVEAAIFLLQSDSKLQRDGSIRMRSYTTRNSLKSSVWAGQSPFEAFQEQPSAIVNGLGATERVSASSRTAVVPLVEKAEPAMMKKPTTTRVFFPRVFGNRRVANFSKSDETQIPEQTSRPSTSVLHSDSRPPPPPFKPQRTMTKLGAQILSTKLSESEKQALLALSDAGKARYVQHVLRVLHWTEFKLLVEFADVMVPIVYCVYLSVAYRLPNKIYYAQLRDTDEAKFESSIKKILIYAMLEGLSLVLLGIMLQHKLRISAMRQLTFVLENQWQQVQSKLILWMAFSIQTPLDHFGMDYSFQFA